MISSLAGVVVFLVFLLFAVQVIVDLYATSTMTAVGFDAARHVASHGVDHLDPSAMAAAERSAEVRARSQLGAFGDHVTFSWDGTDDRTVRLRIRADTPHVGIRDLARPLGLDHVDRTISVRIEQLG